MDCKLRGKPPKIPKDVLEKRYLEIVDQLIFDGKIVTSSNQIFSEIGNEFSVGKQTIYLSAKRFLIKQGLLKEKVDVDNFQGDIEEYVPCEYFGNDFTTRASDICIQLDIETVNLFYKSTNEINITAYWSDTFSGILWEFYQLPCAWKFERLREVCNEFVIVGKCRSTECSKIFGYTQNDKKILKIRLRSFNEEAVHVKKSTIKNSRKEVINNLLSRNTACVVQSKLANDLMTDSDDYVPSTLPNTDALSKQRSRANKNLFLHENPVLAICLMKKQNIYHDIIGDIGVDPFYVFYCTPLQEELVLSRTRYRRTIISIDSSGLPEKDIMFSSVSDEDRGVYKDVFLYVVSLQSPLGNLPAFQFLTQRQNSDFIQYSLACWKTKHFTKKNPDEAIMDHSNALLLSSIQCFTSCKTMHQYLNDCYDSLLNNCLPPRCYIRLDRSHMVKEILHLPCFKNEDKRRKRLYQRIFGYLMTATDITEAEIILKNIFIILLNKYENDLCVSNAKKFLKNIAEKHSIFSSDDNEIEADIEPIETKTKVEEDIFSSQSKFRIWIQKTIEVVKEEYVNETLNCSVREDEDDLVDNLHYAPNLEKPFVDFLVRLPLFSNVMNKTFGSTNTVPTSSPTEVGFHVIKNLVLNSKRKIRIDVILEKHIDFLRGNLNANRQNEQQTDVIYDPIPENRKFDAGCASLEENWRNKNIDAKPKRAIPIKRCLNSILNPAKPFSRAIPILKNGHRTIGTKKNTGILSRLTCSFDSILHILAACYADIPSFANKVEIDDSDLSNLLKYLFSSEMNDVYRLPNEMLVGLLPENVNIHGSNMFSIDCETAVHIMFMRLTSKNMIAQSYSESRECDVCKFVSPKIGKTFIPTNLNGINIAKLQGAVMFNTKKKSCTNCSGTTKICRQLNDVVAMDIEANYKENTENVSVDLASIARELILENRLYVIKGIIEYTSRHFVSHVHRSNGQWETYDDLSPAKIRKTPKLVYPVQLYYTFLGEDAVEKIEMKDISIQDESTAITGPDNLLPFEFNKYNSEMLNSSVDISDPIHSDTNIVSCPACKDKNWPSGAHKCILCGKFVHTCSLSMGGSEGYGEQRICVSCENKRQKESRTTEVTEPLAENSKEKVSSAKKRRCHHAQATAPEDNVKLVGKKSRKPLDENSKEKVSAAKKRRSHHTQATASAPQDRISQISILSNGSSYIFDNVRVFLRNTCSFDSITQILAAALTMHRDIFESTKDEIFEVANLLSKNAHTAKINSARSKLLLNLFGKDNYILVASAILSKTLKQSSSAHEFMSCSKDTCKFKSEILRSYLSMAMDVFANNMENIEVAIANNLNVLVDCLVCKEELCVRIERKFGHHLFIEIPIPSIEAANEDNETVITYKLCQLKLRLILGDQRYFLFGLILFQPPLLKDSIGHYVAAIKVGEEYIVFDDLRKAPYRLEQNEDVIIHLLFYIEEKLDQFSESTRDSNDSSLQLSVHTDDSLYRLYHQ